MFSKDHYTKIARSLAKNFPEDKVMTKEQLVEVLCTMFEQDNPRFNKIVFTMECSGIHPNLVAKKLGEKPKVPPTPMPTTVVRKY